MQVGQTIPVTLSIETEVQDGQEKEHYTSDVTGMMTTKQAAVYIRYTEDVAGAGQVNNVFKIEKQKATLIRAGAIRMRQQFAEGQMIKGEYKSPHGPLAVAAYTKRLHYFWSECQQSGRFHLVYDLNVGGGFRGTFRMMMEIKEGDPG